MKKKKNRKRAIKILSLILALVVCVGLLQEYVLCHADHNRGRIKGFYLEDKDSLDVVLIGASEVYSSFSSCYAYEKFGFTSYPIATAGNIVSNYQTQLKEAVKQQHPKLIIIEVNGMLYGDDDKEEKKEARFRRYADSLPLSPDKVDLIRDYTDDSRWEYYLPIIKYHSVWKDFPKGLTWDLAILKDRIRGYNYLKGAKGKTRIYKLKKGKKIYNDRVKDDHTREDLLPDEEESFRELLDYCRAEKMDNVVFVRFPHMIGEKGLSRYHKSNTVGDMINEYGYEFINFDTDFAATGLDLSKDFYNPEHLNIYGQKKFTEYFGRYLVDHYGITASDLTPEQKEEWDTCVRYYEAFSRYNEHLIEEGVATDIGESYANLIRIKKYLEE